MKAKNLPVILQRVMLWPLFFVAICLPAAHSQWVVEPMPNQHIQFTAVALGDRVFFGPGSSSIGFHGKVDVYNLEYSGWEETLEVSDPRANAAGVAADGKVYFAGGLANSWLDPVMLDVVDIYDTENEEWTTAHLIEARSELTAVQAGDKLLFAGGISGLVGDFTTSPTIITTSAVVDIYDLTTEQWSTATLSQPRVGIASATIVNIAIFAGGQTASGTVTDTVDIYDASTGLWTITTLSEAKGWCSAEALGSKIFIAGGCTADFEVTDKIEILDLETMTWDSASLSQARGGMRSAVLGEKIFFAGGGIYDLTNYFWTPPFFNQVDIYDAVTNTWTEDNLQQGRINHAAAAAGNKFLVAGGVPAFGFAEIFTDDSINPASERLPDVEVLLTPNPVTDAFTLLVQAKDEETFHVEIIDLNSRQVKALEIRGGTKTWMDMAGLAAGSYFVKVYNEKGLITTKVIKQ